MDIHYSTAQVKPALRFDYWSDVVCRYGIPAASRLLKDAPFNGELLANHVGVVSINRMAAPLHHWKREPVHCRQGQEDDFWLCYLADGHALVRQRNREIHLSIGDLLLYDAGRPFDFVLESQNFTFMRLPRKALLHRCPQAEHFVAHTIAPTQTTNVALRAMMEHAITAKTHALRPIAAAQLGSTLLDLAAVMLDVQMAETASTSDHSLYHRALAYIQQHFENPQLCLNDLAQAHHVSPRTLTRAFAHHQQTPVGMLWAARLTASKQALLEGRARSVTQVALDHGFSDPSHFSRAFRQAFGCAPHTLMRR